MGILIDHESPQMTLHASQETLRKKALSLIPLGARPIGQRERLGNLSPYMDRRNLIQSRRKLIRAQHNLTHVQSSLTPDQSNLALERHSLTRVQPRHNRDLSEGSKEHKANKADQPIAESMPAATVSPLPTNQTKHPHTKSLLKINLPGTIQTAQKDPLHHEQPSIQVLKIPDGTRAMKMMSMLALAILLADPEDKANRAQADMAAKTATAAEAAALLIVAFRSVLQDTQDQNFLSLLAAALLFLFYLSY